MLSEFFSSQIGITDIILPIGLSFHTFQSVGYVIDVYKRKVKPENHLGIYASYVLFFPQMVAGPIERYSSLGTQLRREDQFKFDYVKKALPLLVLGYYYKMVIADNCGAYVNEVYAQFFEKNNTNVLLAVFLFCIQIYADFFGYSLIAQGSAQLFGIKLMDNFSFPLLSENIIEFWKKWHISLTNWFRDFVYIPIGGNNGVILKHSFNIILVFSLSGLWHGAGFNFIFWGLLHSIIYLLTYYFLRIIKLKLPKSINIIFTFIIVSLIFIFFRNGKLNESVSIIKNIFTLDYIQNLRTLSPFLFFNLLLILGIEINAKEQYNYSSYINNNSELKNIIIIFYLLFAIITFSGIDDLPFIYFQF